MVFTWAKTNQLCNRVVQLPLTSMPGSPLCPVSAFLNMCTLVPTGKNYPAFGTYGIKGFHPITHAVFTCTLRTLLTKAGYDPLAYSGHSFRRGGATWAFSSGVPGELTVHGDWHSDAYLLYLSMSLESKYSVSQSMAKALY